MCVVSEQVYVDLVRPEFSVQSQNRCFAMLWLCIGNTPHLCWYCLARNVFLALNIP